MGRHRRSAAGRPAMGRATGGTEPHGSSASDRDPRVQDEGAPYPRAAYAQAPSTRTPFPGGNGTGRPGAAERPVAGERPYGTGRPTAGERPGAGNRSGAAERAYPGARPFPGAAERPYAGNRATTGIAPYLNPEAHTAQDPYARQAPAGRSEEYLFATDDDYARATGTGQIPVVGSGAVPGQGRGSGSGRGGAGSGSGPDGGLGPDRSHRRRRKGIRPVRTGLLGVSAAVAIGAVAVATGVLPGSDSYQLGGSGDKVQAAESPTNSETQQGGASGSVEGHDDSGSTSRDADRSASPSSPSPSASTAAPTKKPTKKASPTPAKSVEPSPTASASEAPVEKTTPVAVSAETAAETEVLRLVNVERTKVGCSAVAANSSLTGLAENFSDSMAAEGFFDHTDPSGATPWDRADAAGITNLGGENIARGQADAAAVMDAWMNSEGHRANILNCDFKTLGVGVHFGTGGPWWTQDFGY